MEKLEPVNHPTQVAPIKQFSRDVVGYLPTGILPALFALLGTYYFTRVFSVEEYGLYSLILAFTVPLTTLFAEWIAQPAARYFAEFKESDHEYRYYQVLQTLLFIIGLVIAIMSLLGLFLAWVLKWPINQVSLFIGAVFMILFQVMFVVGVRILPVRLERVAYRRAIVVSSGLSVLFSMLMVHFWGANALWLLIGSALAFLLTLPYIYRHAGFIWRLGNIRPDDSVKLNLRKFWRYGAPMTIWFFAMGLLSIGDRYVIAYFMDNAEVGIYSVNYNLIMQAVGLINGPFMIAIFPIITYQWARGYVTEVHETLSDMTDIYILIGLAMIGGVAVVGQPLTELLLGPGFREGYVVLLPVVTGLVVYGAAIVGQKSIELSERTDLLVRVAVLAAAVNILLNILLVPKFGYVSAAYTTLLSYLVYAGLIWLLAKRFVPWTISPNKSILSVASSLAAVLLTYLCLQFVNISKPFWQLLFGGLLFSLFYAIAILISRHGDLQEYWTANTVQRPHQQ